MARVGELVTMLQHRLPVPVVRVGYRIAYRLALVLWFLTRPDVHGVKGILRDGDRVLLVRHTYGDRNRWDVPGGHAHAGERPDDAVRREMHEELGIEAAWRPVGSLGASTDYKHEHVHCFVADRRPDDGVIVLARGEIAEARWFALEALPTAMSELSLRSLELLRDPSSATGPAASAR